MVDKRLRPGDLMAWVRALVEQGTPAQQAAGVAAQHLAALVGHAELAARDLEQLIVELRCLHSLAVALEAAAL